MFDESISIWKRLRRSLRVTVFVGAVVIGIAIGGALAAALGLSSPGVIMLPGVIVSLAVATTLIARYAAK
jgi:hypothetical protein